MQPAAAVGLGLLAALLAQAVPGTQPLLTAVRVYLTDYQVAFGRLVADEVTVQTVIQWRDLLATRTTQGEFYTVFTDADRVWMSVHDVAVVDGVPVADRPNVFELLASASRGGPALAALNARYNIGASRNINEPTLALQVIAGQRDDVSFDRPRLARDQSAGGLVQMDFRLRNGSRFISSQHGSVKTSGSLVVDPRTGRVHQTTLSAGNDVVTAVLETHYAYNERLDLWVPSLFLETYRQPVIGETTTVRSEYTNYRRFETGGRLRGIQDVVQP